MTQLDKPSVIWSALLLLAAAGIASGLYLYFVQDRQHTTRQQLAATVEGYRAEAGDIQATLTAVTDQLGKFQGEVTALAETLAMAQAERAQLRDRFAGQQVEILRLKDSTVIRVGNAVFFEIGSADIKPSAQPILDTIGRVLADNLKRNVRVEGHTDNVPIGLVLSQAYPSNWELSVARAESAVRYLLNTYPDLNPERLEAIGYGPNRPIATNITERGRQQNRRIEFFLVSDQRVSEQH